jgi:mannose/fructose/N-acetylgalactosamine-specific phosphotransferase system component IID
MSTVDARRRDAAALRVLRVLAPIGTAIMAVTIVTALGSGASLAEEGAAVGTLVWGRVTFVDLGLALVTGWLWIAWREAHVLRAAVWFALTAITGSGALLAYLSIAAWRSDDLTQVLVGPHRA